MGSLFKGSSSKEAAVAFDEEWIDFGASSRLRVAETKVVHLLNRTSGKLTVTWIVPGGYLDGSPKDQANPVFVVSPTSCDVMPNSSATFRVQFRPQSDQQYYCQRLECVAAFKSMRTFRLVSDDNFAAPWCLTLNGIGHTFPLEAEQFIPTARFS